ncbi:DEAD/DEAH box helicase [Pseudonocardia sp. TMWB2A]
MDAFAVRNKVIDDYSSFVHGFMHVKDEQIRTKVEEEVERGLFWPEPWLALNPAFESGGSVGELVRAGVLHPGCAQVFRTEPGRAGRELTLHRHQTDAIAIAQRHESYVLTTGTGSGKSLSYIVPIVDRVLRDGSGRGVRAIVVYPMNALANSQLGELRKFLGENDQKVSFARYTGQESQSERDAIIAKKPDILLTNYMMLELMLTRPRERDGLVATADELTFLVLDELHTYRGRQGADVAMLIRRLRTAIRHGADLQCVGTSATLAGPGTLAEQREEVATLAGRLFGTTIDPGNIVGETLRRATEEIADRSRLAEAIDRAPPTSFDSLRRDDLARWTEDTFGLRVVEGQLTRQQPKLISEAAAELSDLTGRDNVECEEAIRRVLLAGAGARDDNGRSLFAFKLHQFIGKGETVYVTLTSPEQRYLTTRYQRSAPIEPAGQPLFPLAFCRECGQEFLVVNRTRKGEVFRPRVVGQQLDDAAESTGLLLIRSKDWPAHDGPDLHALLPPDWVVESDSGSALDRNRDTRLPEPVRVDLFGTVVDSGGTPAAYFETLHFCPNCLTTYESTQQSEFSRVASLGNGGRASAVSVLSQAVVRNLREADLPAEARKFLAFSDNRQDASLQAGHFNDFVLVGLIRSALFAAVVESEKKWGDPLTEDELGLRVAATLGLSPNDVARTATDDPDGEYDADKQVKKALRDSVAYRVWADLRRGWRITMPNLEQTGQLQLTYRSVDRLATDDPRWEAAGEPLASADADTRRSVMLTLLDEMRRNICVESEFLTEERYDVIRRASRQWLRAPWALAEEQGIYAATCFPGPRPSRTGAGSDLYLSGLGLFGRWLRRSGRFPEHHHAVSVKDADALIGHLLEIMSKVGILERVEERRRPVGYRIKAGMIEWRPGSGEHRAADPLRTNVTEGRVNPYFTNFYAEGARSLRGLEAREHTAQVNPELRQQREQQFSEARLPILYCSPTMELGVDIRSLNVVGMRNVPPTPANYAQRSGRAGRSGQAAVVLTYCATGNAHDNYYFGRSRDMVAGAVAPPRLELGNQDLVRAHAHAVWLVETGLDLRSSMTELVDVDLAGQPLHDDVRSRVHDPGAAARAQERITALLAAATPVAESSWWREDWVSRTVTEAAARFDHALDRWRGLYSEALVDLDAANDVLKTINASEQEKARARGRISEARAALDLLKGEVGDVNQGDFYPYRYFASEGFLPGYSFPRLPLAAFIPGERRTKNGQGDYVQRPRFLAISEFGPGAFIYHEGARFEVNRVSLPAREDGTGVNITEIDRCGRCGYLNDGNGPTGTTECEYCGSTELQKLTSMMRLLAVRTRRRDRISADEEERQRAGHEIVTAIRFEPRGERSSRVDSTVRDADGCSLARLTYGDTALIRRMNVGLRRRKNKAERGYLLDTVEGRWSPKIDPKNAGDDRVQRVVPYVEDHRNALVISFDAAVPAPQRMAAMYALKRAAEAHYQLESSELAVEPLPERSGPNAWARLLFFEAAEGGAGVLRRLAQEDGQLRRVATRALEILHFDPATGEDRKRAVHAHEDCAQACYDCLLSYANQWDHQELDRHTVQDLLLRLATSTTEVGGAGEERDAQFVRLAGQSSPFEKTFLRWLDEHGYRLPDAAQQVVDGFYARPDFSYHPGGMDVAVFVDGPVHDDPRQTERDEAARARLEEEAGWTVVRFRHDDPSWHALVSAHPAVFGHGRAGA